MLKVRVAGRHVTVQIISAFEHTFMPLRPHFPSLSSSSLFTLPAPRPVHRLDKVPVQAHTHIHTLTLFLNADIFISLSLLFNLLRNLSGDWWAGRSCKNARYTYTFSQCNVVVSSYLHVFVWADSCRVLCEKFKVVTLLYTVLYVSANTCILICACMAHALILSPPFTHSHALQNRQVRKAYQAVVQGTFGASACMQTLVHAATTTYTNTFLSCRGEPSACLYERNCGVEIVIIIAIIVVVAVVVM